MPHNEKEKFLDLLELIRHTDRVAVRIYGITDKEAIFTSIENEFADSKKNHMMLLLLTEDKMRLSVKVLTLPSVVAKPAEKIIGRRIKDVQFDFDKCRILHRVLNKGETYSFPTIELIKEIFPPPIAHLIATVTGYNKKSTIVAPIHMFGDVIGLLGIDTPELLDYFIPFINNFARHISTALELCEETSKRVETQLKLEKKNREILEFTNSITHDLKKPLAVMKTVCSLVKNEACGKLNEEGMEAVGMGAEAISYMEDMLEDLLASAQLEAGVSKLMIEEFDLNALISEVATRFKYLIEEKKVKVSIHEALGRVKADRKNVGKVYMNLIGNALHYIGQGPDKRIEVGVATIEGEKTYFVRDNGIGIPEDSKATLFQKFKRGSNIGDVGGTGLGLSIVKGIVDAHGGRVWAESKVNEGSTFYFTL